MLVNPQQSGHRLFRVQFHSIVKPRMRHLDAGLKTTKARHGAALVESLQSSATVMIVAFTEQHRCTDRILDETRSGRCNRELQIYLTYVQHVATKDR